MDTIREKGDVLPVHAREGQTVGIHWHTADGTIVVERREGPPRANLNLWDVTAINGEKIAALVIEAPSLPGAMLVAQCKLDDISADPRFRITKATKR